MAKKFEKLGKRIKEAMVNPKLDKLKKEVREGLKSPKGSVTAASLLNRALIGLEVDLNEMKVPEANREKYRIAYREHFKKLTEGIEVKSVLESLDGKKLDAFVNSYAKYAKLDAVIAKSIERDSKDPMKRFVQRIRAASPLLAPIGASIMAWLNKNKKEEKKGEPSNLEAKAAKADEVLAEGKGKKGKKKKKEDKTEDSSKEAVAPTGSVGASGEAVEDTGSAAELDVDVNQKRKGPLEYKPDAEYSKKKLSGKEFMAKYKSIKDRHERHMFALQQVALGNVPKHFNQFESMKKVGANGTKVEYKVARHNQRIGTDGDYVEVPFDGPTASAAATIQGCTLATPWVLADVYANAKENGGVITFYGGQDLAQKAGKSDWERWMMSAEGMAQAFNLRRKEFKGKEGQITAGHFKNIGPPRASNIRAQSLNINGGRYESGEKVQDFPGNFHGDSYSDASHGVRMVKNGSLIVNGKPMSWDDFNSNPEYAKEFGFHVIPKGAKYASTPELIAFVDAKKPEKKDEKPPVAVAAGGDKDKKNKPS